MTDKCVYAHRRSDNGEVFYVGKGTEKRPYDEDMRGQDWHRIQQQAGGYKVEIIERNLSDPDALDLEAMMIMHFGRASDGGTLCNTSLGAGPNHPAKERVGSVPVGGKVRVRSDIIIRSCAASGAVTHGAVMDDALKLLAKLLTDDSTTVLESRLKRKYGSFQAEYRKQKTKYEQRARRAKPKKSD